MAQYFKTVFLRPDLLDAVTSTLTKAGISAMDSDVTKDKFGNFILKIANNPKVKSGIYNKLLYQPVKSFFSFGATSEEEEVESRENKE